MTDKFGTVLAGLVIACLCVLVSVSVLWLVVKIVESM